MQELAAARTYSGSERPPVVCVVHRKDCRKENHDKELERGRWHSSPPMRYQATTIGAVGKGGDRSGMGRVCRFNCM